MSRVWEKKVSDTVYGRGLVALSVMWPAALLAGTATVNGTLSGFDINNDNGVVAHGFEIRLEGAAQSDLYYAGYGERYGLGTAVPYAGGMTLRWQSVYNTQIGQYTQTTPVHVGNPSFAWQDCYVGGAGYATSGCEHFRQGLRWPVAAGMVASGRWLVEDSANPGTLTPMEPPVAIPVQITYTLPPVVVSAPPVVVAEIEPPEPPETPETYGDAQWVKIYKTQLTREATPEDLDTLSGVVPTEPSQIEVAWDILQASPPAGGNGNRRRHQNQGNLSPDTRAIVRRYETYKYTGAYDAVTHQAVCADTTCTAPSTGELGDLIGAHNAAINLTPDVVTVAKTGNGSVTGSGINCGSTCSAFSTNGSSVTLTASPGNSAFTGWTGACSGTQLSCTVTVNGITAVGADFKPQYTLSVGRSNTGLVSAAPNGNDRVLSCGSACSAKFTEGTTVILTATPPANRSFVNWSGACSGTSPTCSITISRDTSVQAVFSR